MKSTLISKENNQAKFTMEFTGEEFENAVINVYKEQKDKFTIDGFRKGKAPRSIIEKKYGEGVFYEDAINNLFSINYPEALAELSLDVIDRPRVTFSAMKKGEGFTATVMVECYPVVEVKDYKGVEIEAVNPDVTDEDIDKELETRAKRNARMIAVDRPAENGDTVIIDYEGWVGDEQFEGGTAENHPLKLGSSTFIPGFEEQLIGASKNDDREVKVTFPEEYHSKDLAGKEAVFKCKVHEVKEEEVPEINDEFVKDISEFDTLDELKEDIRKELQKTKAAKAEASMKNSVLAKVFEANDIDVPEVLVENEIDNTVAEFAQQLQIQGLDINTYMQYFGKEMKDFRDDLREEAHKKVKTRMIVTAVADQEDFEVTDEEVNQEIERMAKQYGMEADKIRETLGAQNVSILEGDIKIRKAIDLMYDSAVKK